VASQYDAAPPSSILNHETQRHEVSHEQDVEQHCLHGVVADEAAHVLVVNYEGVHANEHDEPAAAAAAAAAAVQVSDAALAAQIA
jgi:hypothetical protein